MCVCVLALILPSSPLFLVIFCCTFFDASLPNLVHLSFYICFHTCNVFYSYSSQCLMIKSPAHLKLCLLHFLSVSFLWMGFVAEQKRQTYLNQPIRSNPISFCFHALNATNNSPTCAASFLCRNECKLLLSVFFSFAFLLAFFVDKRKNRNIFLLVLRNFCTFWLWFKPERAGRVG